LFGWNFCKFGRGKVRKSSKSSYEPEPSEQHIVTAPSPVWVLNSSERLRCKCWAPTRVCGTEDLCDSQRWNCINILMFIKQLVFSCRLKNMKSLKFSFFWNKVDIFPTTESLHFKVDFLYLCWPSSTFWIFAHFTVTVINARNGKNMSKNVLLLFLHFSIEIDIQLFDF
jgi:hypothetical protein